MPSMRVAAGAIVFSVLIAAALATFAWPSARLEPRDLPLGVAGPAGGARAVEARLGQSGAAFDVHRYADEAAARRAIEERKIYGAVIASRDAMTLLTASAASPVVAQVLREMVASRDRVRVIDVVPADADDPRGVAFASVALPLTLVSVVVGLISALRTPVGYWRATTVAGAAVLAGLVAVGIVQGWLGIVAGDWWLNAGAVALIVLAIGSLVAGLTTLLARHGAALAAVVLVFFGNPWSGISTAPDLLPKWVGFTGQLLPPGAGGSLLRSTAFFDGSGSGAPVAVLLVWAALGLTAVLLSPARRAT